MAHIQISSPLLRSFVHEDGTVDTVATASGSTQILDYPTTGTKRIIVIIQNKSTTASIEVIFNATGDDGILVAAGQLLSVDNYNGIIRVNASADTTPIHLAYSEV